MRAFQCLLLAVLMAGLPSRHSAAAEPAALPSVTVDLADFPRINKSVRDTLAAGGETRTSLRLDDFPLASGLAVTLDLESFEVWAPDAAIVEHGVDGARRLSLPEDRYYRGTVVGEPGSLVFLAAGRNLRGLVFLEEEVFAILPEGDAYDSRSIGGDSWVRKIDLESDRPMGTPTFLCGAEKLESPMHYAPLTEEPQRGVGTLYTGTVYVASIAVETDHELYVKLGSSSAALTQYVGDLVAASSAIYQRDIQVQKTVAALHIYTGGAASDPWTQTSTEAALYELGDYWHANYPIASNPRSTVHLLSGKNGGGGIAWTGALCMTDFLCGPVNCGSAAASGHYAGGYGVSSSLSGQFSTSNPNLYWDLLCFSHEVGHNFNSRHTHCYVPAVDTCCPCEPASAAACVGPVPPEKGTIMSYCHLRPGGYSNVKLYLAVQAETSVAVYNVMRTFVEGKTACLPVSGGPGPTLSLVSPGLGSTAGGTSITITGANFRTGAMVTLGGTVATGVVVGSASSITALTPAHAAGAVAVVVRNSDSQSGTLPNGFTYSTALPAPTVTSVTPNLGPLAGGTSVTITGTNFVSGATVAFGGSTVAGTFVSSTTLTATAPAHAMGAVNVVVTNPDAQAGTLTNGYFYAPATPATATLWYPVTPCRILDTRLANGPLGGPALSANQTRTFDVTTNPQTCGVPSTAMALTVNYTVVNALQPGELRAFRGNGTWTGTNVVTFKAGVTRTNNGYLQLATDGTGTIKFTNASAGTADAILDVTGYHE